jgi:hypothetical protein
MATANNRSLVSVVIPAFNAERFIAEALDSVFAKSLRVRIGLFGFLGRDALLFHLATEKIIPPYSINCKEKSQEVE